MDKRGQIHISFGMIFSVIMIIIFIGFAFFAIQKFLAVQKTIQVTKFYDDLQTHITTAWNSPYTIEEKSYIVPRSIGEICFSDTGEDNMVVYNEDGKPTGGISLEHIDIVAIVSGEDSCFENIDGRINLVLRKDLNDILVTIEH